MTRTLLRVARVALELWGLFWIALVTVEWIADSDLRRRRARHLRAENHWDRMAEERRARGEAAP